MGINRQPPPPIGGNAYRQPIVPHIPGHPGTAPQQAVYTQQQQPPAVPGQQIARPITLQPQDSPRSSTPTGNASSKQKSQTYVPPGDDYIRVLTRQRTIQWLR